MIHKKANRLIGAVLAAAVAALAALPAASAATTKAGDFTIKDGVLVKYGGAGGTVTVPSTVTSIGSNAFADFRALTAVRIPDSVTSIGDDAFARTGLISVTLPDSVKSLGASAFDTCKHLKKAVLPDGLTKIRDFTFAFCVSLKSVNIPTSTQGIGTDAFGNCKLTNVKLPGSLRAIGGGAFSGCPLKSLTVPDGVKTIGNSAFCGCNELTSAVIPKSVEKIGTSAIAGIRLQSISVDAKNPYLSSKNGVLYNHDKTELIQFPAGRAGSFTAPSSVKRIDTLAFAYSIHLTKIVLQNGVERIGQSALDSSGVTAITVPKSVTDFGFDCLGSGSIVTVYGYTGSPVQAYAKSNKIQFRAIGAKI